VHTWPAGLKISQQNLPTSRFLRTAEKWKAVPKPPSDSSFGDKLFSGIIELEAEALTDFYTRGMWSLGEFRKSNEEQQPEPFRVDGALRLPGSSLRGMIRTLVEIITGAPLDPINNTQLFFRTVASVGDPNNLRSFEPQATAYKSRIVPNGVLSVKAGYLYNNRDQWTVRPASVGDDQKQYYRYRTSDRWLRRKIAFDPDGDFADERPDGEEQGWLVCSGLIYGKEKQWVVRSVDPKAAAIDIPEDVVKAYQSGGITRDILKNGFEYTNQSQGVPCFFLDSVDENGAHYIDCFGHTPYFRMPYEKRPQDRIPEESSRQGREEQWDMAQAMFGYVPDGHGSRRSRRGRVFFEDGIWISGPEPAVAERVRSAVLGQPKPTTYQHYLRQTSDQLGKVVHWDGDLDCKEPVFLRGHKLYWHRPDAPIPEPEPGKGENVASRFREAKKGARFSIRIRFDNLYKEELGALLAALQLPKGCAHKLGMGKPLGLGSFQIRIVDARLIDRKQRYSSFFDTAGQLVTGLHPSRLPVQLMQDVFARWYPAPEQTMAALWKTERFKELKALLTFSPLPDGWTDITRTLEFGRAAADYNQGRNYNEYNEVGYRILQRPRLEKRRPLPPATQVLQAGPNIPRDPRPDFQPPSSESSPRKSRPPGSQRWR
jgi:hypothetical protein